MDVLWLTLDRVFNRIAGYYEYWLANLQTCEGINMKIVRTPLYGLHPSKYRKAIWYDRSKCPRKFTAEQLNSYDLIVVEDFFYHASEDWQNVTTPIALFIEDMHGSGDRQLKFAEEAGARFYIYRYDRHFREFHHMLRDNTVSIWCPHSVDTSVFKDYGRKTRDVIHVGIVSKDYPTRQFIVQTLKGKPYFQRIERPPDSMAPLSTKTPVREDYARMLSSAKICPTGGSVYHYPVAKYMEICACNTLLMSDWFDELGDLGFVRGENMVEIHRERFVEQVEYFLAHDGERERIAKAGYELVRERHSGEVRAKGLVQTLQWLLK